MSLVTSEWVYTTEKYRHHADSRPFVRDPRNRDKHRHTMRSCNVRHAKVHPITRANTTAHVCATSSAPIERHGTVSHWPGADGRDCRQRPSCGLARRRSCARLRPADRPSRTVAGRAACAVTGRRSWSPERRISTLTSLLRRAVAQGVQMRRQKSRAGGAAAAQRAAASMFETC